MNEDRTIWVAEHGLTHVHPLAVAFLVCMCILAFWPRRSAATLAVLTICVFIPLDQRIVIAGLDFSFLRLITIVAWVRILIRGEYRGLGFGKLDRFFVLWVLSASLLHVLRVGPGVIVYRLGTSFDALSAFFLIRVLLRTRVDVVVLWRQVAWITIVLTPFLLYEFVTGHNAFGVFRYEGWDLAQVRDGSVRASGPFSHPILAGTFSSVLIPVFIGILMSRKNQRMLFGTACVSATIATLTSGSSGPLVALGVGALGWGIWRIRRHMQAILWTAVGMAVVIHFVREKPVWHLIVRLSSITGGTGYHRYRLIDAFINNFSEWVLVGTDSTASWGWGLQDTTNQYVAEGIGGGLVTLVLFILVLRTSFVQLRVARNVFERLKGPKSLWALLAWGTSVSLAAHCVSFISVSYFGQLQIFFVYFIATIPALAKLKRSKRVMSPSARLSRNASTPTHATRVRPSN